jgi:hypothetical protein
MQGLAQKHELNTALNIELDTSGQNFKTIPASPSHSRGIGFEQGAWCRLLVEVDEGRR